MNKTENMYTYKNTQICFTMEQLDAGKIILNSKRSRNIDLSEELESISDKLYGVR